MNKWRINNMADGEWWMLLVLIADKKETLAI